jgi:hypothetical protein
MMAAALSKKGAKAMKRSFAARTLAAGLLVLAGCSGGPSDGDIQSALEKDLAASRSPVGFIERALGTKVTSVKQTACAQEKEGGVWACDVKLSIETMNPLNGNKETSEGADKVRLKKTDAGWAVAR